MRKLLAHLVVCLALAMSLRSKAAMRDVLKKLVDGLSVQWMRLLQQAENTQQCLNIVKDRFVHIALALEAS